MNLECRQAEAPTHASAVHASGSLIVSARGEMPNTCWRVSLGKSPLSVWPPEFYLEACPTSEVCLEVITPYTVLERFPMESAPEHIVLRGEGYEERITVDAEPVTRVGPDVGYVGSALGHDIGEALARAVSRLPPGPGTMGRSGTVEEIWYEDGGIVGPQVHVRVKPRKARARKAQSRPQVE
jgi:hypothetical protein